MIKTFFGFLFILGFYFNTAHSQSLSAEQIYTKINNAVVTIYTFDANGKLLAQGSGVVLNEKGWVVTNYHVYAGAEKLIVKHKEKLVNYSNIIGLDVEKDILILKIADHAFPPIKLGNSDLLKVGQKIYAIGSPMGFENTITEGIISGLRTNEEKTKNFIQVSAPISPGSSGGAVVNDKGELIAITTLSVTKGQNLNFAIPINEVQAVYKKGGINSNTLSAAFYFNKGYTEYHLNHYSDAIDAFKKAISIDPQYSSAYLNLGSAYKRNGNIEAAIIFFKKYLSFMPLEPVGYFNLGVAYNTIGQHETAINYYKKAIDINSKYLEPYNNLGSLYSDLGDHENAINYYKKAIEVDPKFDDGYYNLGLEYELTGDIENAIYFQKQAVSINPENFLAYYDLGKIYADKKEFETAIINFKKSININPTYIEAYFGLGIVYHQKREFESAITYYKKTIDINPKFAKGYYHLGLVYGNIGDVYMKNYYFEKARQLEPSYRN